MGAGRVLKHLVVPHWISRKGFSRRTVDRIRDAIRDSESKHLGEICFVVEGGLPVPFLFMKKPARARAEDLFARLRVWDTEHNSGVLVYVQLVDRRIEIVADLGISAKVGQAAWDKICRRMEEEFRAGRFEDGALHGVEAITALLARHFPPTGSNPDELPNRPVVL